MSEPHTDRLLLLETIKRLSACLFFLWCRVSTWERVRIWRKNIESKVGGWLLSEIRRYAYNHIQIYDFGIWISSECGERRAYAAWQLCFFVCCVSGFFTHTKFTNQNDDEPWCWFRQCEILSPPSDGRLSYALLMWWMETDFCTPLGFNWNVSFLWVI